MQDNFWSESKNLFEEFKKKAKIKELYEISMQEKAFSNAFLHKETY